MISTKVAEFCKENPVLIEGYAEAHKDKYTVWKCWHKNEITQFGKLTKYALVKLGLWYNRPASELKFLPKSEWLKLKGGDTEHDKSIVIPLTYIIQLTGKDIQAITQTDIDNMHNTLDRLSTIYRQIKANCYSEKSKAYKFYGGKGIKMCQEWYDDHHTFRMWCLQNGWTATDNPRAAKVVRIDKRGDYSPSNCRIEFAN